MNTFIRPRRNKYIDKIKFELEIMVEMVVGWNYVVCSYIADRTDKRSYL